VGTREPDGDVTGRPPSWPGRLAAYLVLGGASLVALFPIFWTVSTSLKQRVDSFAIPPRFLGFAPTLRNYRRLFDDPDFVRVIGTTVLITALATLVAVAVGLLSAYALARSPRFAGRRPLEVTLILVRAMPGVVLIVPLYRLAVDAGALGHIWSLVLVYAVFNLPFAIWLMTPFVAGIPVELEECARVDGAGRLYTFVRVVLPLTLPGLAATSIFVALLSWNEFLIPIVLGGEATKTLPVYISGFVSARTLDWGPLAAASSLAIVPIAVVTVLIQRRLVAGLSSGALKE
jgi:ABC-type glycerol-3-phosphate transport system permease component